MSAHSKDINASRRRSSWLALVLAMLVVLVVAAPAGAAPQPDSRGTDFWVTFPQNYAGGAELSLFITGDTAATGTVEIPGLAFTEPFSVTPGTVTTVAVPSSASPSTGDGVQALGIHITSTSEVSVYGLNRIQYSTDAYLGLPTDILGTEYVLLGWDVGLGGGPEFAVIGTQDGTTVTITPRTTVNGHPAGTPYTVALNKGDVYQLIGNDSLTGTTITSDKPVGVFGGHQCANIPDTSTTACDHVVEEIPPTATWGKSFVTEPLATRTRGDTFRILASQDNTQVSIDGTVVATLNRGEIHQQLIAEASVITADKPVLVAQYSNGSSFDGVTSDPFMMLVPPFEQFLASYTVTTPATGFATNFINLVVPNGAVGSVKLDGSPILASNFTQIGSSGFSGAQIAVSAGSHTVDGPQPFGVFVYGFDSYDSYGYPGGLSLAPVARVTKVTLTPETATNQVGSEHCVDALVTDQDEKSLAGVRVDFRVTGVNSTTGFESSNASGVARFCYTGTNAGDDTITATVGTLSDTATKRWVLDQANLSITKSDAPDPVSVGGVLTYTLTVRNGGTSGATGVTVTDDLASGVTYDSATSSQGSCSKSGSQVTCALGSLANGATATATIKVRPTATGTLSNTAGVRGNEADPDMSNNSASAGTNVVQAPVSCAGAGPDLTSLWPPNHKLRLITLPDANGMTFRVTGVTQDEPVNGTGDGDTSPDAKSAPKSNQVYLRAERSGNGDGRVYRIAFEGSNGNGGTCTATTTVGVPHDQGKGSKPKDSGKSFNSFGG
jgi:uncharacterized repeat protein (TIGR01451 family)